MPGKRSAERWPSAVRKRERRVAVREERVDRLESTAPKVNDFAVLLAKQAALEAATTATMATKLAAHHLVEDLGAHSDELLTSAKIRAPARACARRATAPAAHRMRSVCRSRSQWTRRPTARPCSMCSACSARTSWRTTRPKSSASTRCAHPPTSPPPLSRRAPCAARRRSSPRVPPHALQIPEP